LRLARHKSCVYATRIGPPLDPQNLKPKRAPAGPHPEGHLTWGDLASSSPKPGPHSHLLVNCEVSASLGPVRLLSGFCRISDAGSRRSRVSKRRPGPSDRQAIRPPSPHLVKLRFTKFRLVSSRVHQSELSPLEDHCPSLDSTTSATPLGGRCIRLCVVPCLACGPSPDTPAPFSFALPWAEVTSRACSGGS
jgi:hypothetical protein